MKSRKETRYDVQKIKKQQIKQIHWCCLALINDDDDDGANNNNN